MDIKSIRATLLDLLDNDEGVSAEGYDGLREMAEACVKQVGGSEADLADIFDIVEGGQGRSYLPEEHGLVADTKGAGD